MDEEWVLFFRDSAGRDVRVASTSKQAALIQAREPLRQHYVVHKIEARTKSSTAGPLRSG